MLIDELAKRLQDIYAGAIEEGLQPWLTDEALARLLAEALVVQPPKCVLYNEGEPLRCHANALLPSLLGVALPAAKPWFGFSVVDRKWWCHSWWIDGGVLIDSCPGLAPRIFWGMPWDAELFRMLFPGDDLPTILTKERQHDTAIDSRHALTSCDGPRKP